MGRPNHDNRFCSPAGRVAAVAASIVLAVCLLANRARAEDEGRRVVLLVTHPVPRELANIKTLVERELLRVPGLRVVGITYEQEWEDYSRSEQWISRNAPGWMKLERISCELGTGDVFRQNSCRGEFARLVRESDGIFFTGGPDIPPRLYGEQTLLTTVIEQPPRHRFEISFLANLIGTSRNPSLKPLLQESPEYVVLGICLGMQSMNVAAGGTLIQDIPSQVYGMNTFEQAQEIPAHLLHRSYTAPLEPAPGVGWAVVHPVRQAGGWTHSSELFGQLKQVRVVSLHHQAVGRLGAGLRPWATSVDGKIAEGLFHERWPAVFGVQFHPEKQIIYRPDLEYPKEPGGSGNYIAAWFSGDPDARRFHRAFWALVGRLLVHGSRVR